MWRWGCWIFAEYEGICRLTDHEGFVPALLGFSFRLSDAGEKVLWGGENDCHIVAAAKYRLLSFFTSEHFDYNPAGENWQGILYPFFFLLYDEQKCVL